MDHAEADSLGENLSDNKQPWICSKNCVESEVTKPYADKVETKTVEQLHIQDVTG